MNSRQSGKIGERLIRDELILAWRCDAQRTAQNCGKGDTADVAVSVPGLHCECKFLGGGSPALKWHAQAKSDSEGKSIPLVIFKSKRRTPTLLIMDVNDSESFARALVKHLDGATDKSNPRLVVKIVEQVN